MTKLWILLALAAASLASPARAEDDDEDRATFSVPKSLRGRGYSLRLDGRKRELALDDESLSLSLRRRADVSLVDQHGRTLDRGSLAPGGDLALRERTWSLGASTALVTNLDTAAWRKALLPKKAHEQSLELAWRPGPWSGLLQWTRRFVHRSLDESSKLDYEASILLLGVAREVAVQKFHLAVLVAGGVTEATYELSDDYVSIERSARSAAFATGVEARLPVYGNLWLHAKTLLRAESLAIDELDADGLVLLNSSSLGVSYAF